jgi:hypothetical protein
MGSQPSPMDNYICNSNIDTVKLRSLELGWVEYHGWLELIWKSCQFSLYFYEKKHLSLEQQYLEQSNSINGPVNNKIMKFTMPNLNNVI